MNASVTEKFRITHKAKGQLVALVFITDDASRIASILPIDRLQPAPEPEVSAGKMLHQRSPLGTPSAPIIDQLLEAAGISPAEVHVGKAPWQ